jgi:hypothetical protein
MKCQICLDEVRREDMFDDVGCKRCAKTEYGPISPIRDVQVTVVVIK